MKAMVAGLASFLLPGLGHLFGGRFLAGALWFVGWVVCPWPIVHVVSGLHAVYVTAK